GIAVRYFFKPSIEAIKQLVQALRIGCNFTWTQHYRTQCRRKGKCHKSRNQYRNSNCYRKLLIELTDHSRDKSYRNKHRSQYQSYRYNRSRDVFHRPTCGFFGIQLLNINIVLHSLDHDNSIIHHDTNRQNEGQHGQIVDGETKEREKYKGSQDRHWYRQYWN